MPASASSSIETSLKEYSAAMTLSSRDLNALTEQRFGSPDVAIPGDTVVRDLQPVTQQKRFIKLSHQRGGKFIKRV